MDRPSSSTRISLVFGGHYDRLRDLPETPAARDGLVDIRPIFVDTPAQAFEALSGKRDFDGGEMSLSFYSTMLSKLGASCPLVALPIFTSRAFRHGNILINSRAPIDRPSDLAGRRIGVPEYGATMVLWVRGILRDHYGTDLRDASWWSSRQPVALSGDELRHPPGAEIHVSSSTDLIGLLAQGDLDAYIGSIPRNLPEGVERLFPDYGATERAYYGVTGIFPIMHVLALRRTWVDQHPEAVSTLVVACHQARDRALADLWKTGALHVSLPWLTSVVEDQTKAMGGQLWSYGVDDNRNALETFLDYAELHGTLWDSLSVDELFWPDVVGAPKQPA